MLDLWLFCATMVGIYMIGWFLASIVLKRNDIVDLAWGPGFIVLIVASLVYSENVTLKTLLVGVLVSIWAIRLALHIAPRLIRRSEDFRYANWRKQWGHLVYLRSFFQIYLLQSVVLLAVGSSLVVNAYQPSGFGLISWVGIVVWLTGFSFEAVSDAQLASFLKKPSHKGKLMTSGLWRYSRHPNYFGEIVQWWGIFLVVLPNAYWPLALLSPVTISLLIRFVSGVPLLEKQFRGRAGFATYARKTSLLIPLPPRK